MKENIPEKRVVTGIGKVLGIVDDVILYAVVVGIIIIAIRLLIEAGTDFFDYSQHSIPHVISDLMLVLIIMELFRQVMRQINKQAFSLNPFFYIGLIASVRAILITQMRVGLGETVWSEGVWQLLANVGLVLVFVLSLYVYSLCKKDDGA
ncbi:MAG: phosphate-starvation-inducible PsiE family protein [Thermodesulfobacteriota bacterium]